MVEMEILMEAAWSAHGLGPVAVNEDGLLGGWMASSRVSSSLNRLLEVGFWRDP